LPEQALYLKWRPLSFDDVVGQDHITRTLRNSLVRGKIRHAYLFSGPRGTGKTTSARLLAKAVNCTHKDPSQHPCNDCSICVAINEGRFLDLIEIDAASHTGVDDVRDLRDKIAFTPGEGKYKVYIIDEVHRFSGNAFDALLKTLEEPPDHAIFILATTEIDKVPATIKSRCLQFEFRRVSLHEVTDRLAMIAQEEGLNIDPAAIELLARQGTGSVRDSISLLDQIVTEPDEVVTLELAQRMLGTANTVHVREVVNALVAEDVSVGIHVVNKAIDSGSDPRQFGQQIVEILRNIMLAQTASADLVEASQEDQEMYMQLANTISRGRLLKAIRAFNDAVNNYTGGWQPQLALELALIESLQDDEVQIVQQVVQQTAPQTRPLSRSEKAKLEEEQATQPSSSSDSDFERAEATQPGDTPIYSVSKIRESWTQILAQANRYNRNIAPLFEHAHVRTMDGNRLTLGVMTQIFKEKLSDPERSRFVEQAIFDIHEVKLRLQVQLVDSEYIAENEAVPSDIDDDDPLVDQMRQLGGEIDTDAK
jgi:DNA polymerase III subunit gamma/tau